MTETPNETPAADSTPDVAALQAEVEKWKAMSRKNEDRFKTVSQELDGYRQSTLTEQEKALEAARAEARKAVAGEFGTRLAEAELRAQAAKVGVELPSLEYLNVGSFVTEDGTVNGEAVAGFVSSLPKPVDKPEFAQGLGLGRQGGSGVPQLTREDMARMTPAQIVAAKKEGKFDALQRGEV
ncbi:MULTISPECIES: hypothetical protein [Streptomyces]|uniref:hypothetical protein n=1 Tax=Streptomyces TaxID=1883 RepID=UPI001E2D1ED1|nr:MULTISPECIES: hypothetical protein [Streptomyces]UFQ16405.1 hypothetical protein J2N69_16130 [Streptomyces huasconensis]WCL86008.1 hypothetical protein PPN52_16135 [Streptomyces sp. JCM 35825]